ncbi:MAG: metal-dependent hydrolase [bacterium]|nr:metal-dependent hydrolase [bacterium]
MERALTSSLPDGVNITYRRMHFELDAEVPRYWHGGDPGKTHFFTALSLLFPEGEKFFIDSVRHFEDADLDPKTREEIREFVKQEAHHTYQHRIYNSLVAAQGLNTECYENFLRRALGLVRKIMSHKTQLAITVALEHFTAVLANQLLTNPDLTKGMHSAVKPLWLWHAVEETEHKAVCFDVYQQVGGQYWMRVLVMARIMMGFPVMITLFQLGILFSDPRSGSLRTLWKSLLFIWGKGGFVRAVLPELKTFFRREFHPWDVDNRDLIPAWEVENTQYLARG